MTTEEKFNAAVNVIRNLPKDGAYQPSHEMKLKFYAYYKQATEGPCTGSKPAFWDVIGRIKWEAWKKLGNMTKEEAMTNYVEELKQIVDTMSYNANVETFLGSLGNFYESVPPEDLEMLLGPVIERVRSHSGSPMKISPLVSRETSPSRMTNNVYNNSSVLEKSPVSSGLHPPESEDEDEEYIDTVETTPYLTKKICRNSPVMTKKFLDSKEETHLKEKPIKHNSSMENGHTMNNCTYVGNGNGVQNGITYGVNGNLLHNVESDDEKLNFTTTRTRVRDKESPIATKRRVVKHNGGPKAGTTSHANDVSEPIREAILHLQKDIDRITARVKNLEVNVLLQPQDRVEAQKSSWPFADISSKTTVFMIVWPFLVHFLMLHIQQRRSRQCTFFFFSLRNDQM